MRHGQRIFEVADIVHGEAPTLISHRLHQVIRKGVYLSVSLGALNIQRLPKTDWALSIDRKPVNDMFMLYARHASDSADGLITRLPKEKVSRALKGSRIEIELRI